MFATPQGTHIVHPGHLFREANTAHAMNAACHGGGDQRPHVFVFDRALVFVETIGTAAKSHGLILQVTLAALVTNRAI